MHVRELVELGALVATRGLIYIQRSNLLTKRRMEQYWLASRFRQDRWMRAMKVFDLSASTLARPDSHELRPVIEEVLASELVTRTWAAVACAHERRHGGRFLEPIMLSVLSSHQEARDRAVQFIMCGKGLPLEDEVALNHLRRLTERWTDVLLGYLAGAHDIEGFAFNADRARDSANDLRDEQLAGREDQPWKLAMMSLQGAFERGLMDSCANPDLNARIAGSILACFDSEMFESRALLAPYWMLRLNQIADETVGLVEDLLLIDQVPALRFSLSD
ncbi:MAG: hypothetical protein ACYC0X_18910 [Pirellulaceae bacterium]